MLSKGDKKLLIDRKCIIKHWELEDLQVFGVENSTPLLGIKLHLSKHIYQWTRSSIGTIG